MSLADHWAQALHTLCTTDLVEPDPTILRPYTESDGEA
jgi:hypothetical protein